MTSILALGSILVVSDEQTYEQKRGSVLQQLPTKTCFVCLSRTYLDVVQELKHHSLDPHQFSYIDFFTSHYAPHIRAKNTIFCTALYDLEEVKQAISDAVQKYDATCLFFDPITELLAFHPSFAVLHFVNDLIKIMNGQHKKVFIALKDAENEENIALIQDLQMFTDHTIQDIAKLKSVS